MKNIKAPDKKLVAMIAPSIAGQFGCSIYKLKSAIKKAGFDEVIEVAQGADITTINEAKEFEERMEEGAPFMTTSCCAGYNNLTATGLPEIQEFKSTTGTPLFYTAQIVREQYPDAISVFVSPCVAKRKEGMNNENVDYVMNYQELNALIKGRKINIEKCEEEKFDKEDIFKGHTRLFVIESIISKKLDIDLPSNFYKFSLEERMMLLKAVKEGKLDTDISKLKPVLTIGEYHFLKGGN